MKDFFANSLIAILASALFITACVFAAFYLVFIYPFQWAISHGLSDKDKNYYGDFGL